MQISRLVEVVELTVPFSNHEELLFRIEILSQGRGGSMRYLCRLYRLESFRFKALSNSNGSRIKWVNADYRSWVVDDNLGLETKSYKSASIARREAIATLKQQLGLG